MNPIKTKLTPSATVIDAIASYLSANPTPTAEENPDGLVGISVLHRNANPTGKLYETYLALVELEKRGEIVITLNYINFEEVLYPTQRTEILTEDVVTVIEVFVKSLISPPTPEPPCRSNYLSGGFH